MSGRGRSTPATVAPHRRKTDAGPTSEPTPSATRVRPGSRSHSGLAATISTEVATDGSTTPADTQARKLGGEPVPGKQLTPHRDLESGDRRGAPTHPDRLVGGCVQHRRVAEGHLLTVLDPPHPAGERVGALPGNRYRHVGTDEPGLDQTREVRQVARAPGGLAGRSRGADRVHAIESRSYHRAAERCRAPPLRPSLAGEREVDLVRRRHIAGPHAPEVTPRANRSTRPPSPAHRQPPPRLQRRSPAPNRAGATTPQASRPARGRPPRRGLGPRHERAISLVRTGTPLPSR